VNRLLDSSAVRAALNKSPEASLALIVSDAVFQRVVVTKLDGIRPAQFRRVLVDLPEKRFREHVHIYIPGSVDTPGYRPAARIVGQPSGRTSWSANPQVNFPQNPSRQNLAPSRAQVRMLPVRSGR
jgi:hypothetical protein